MGFISKKEKRVGLYTKTRKPSVNWCLSVILTTNDSLIFTKIKLYFNNYGRMCSCPKSQSRYLDDVFLCARITDSKKRYPCLFVIERNAAVSYIFLYHGSARKWHWKVVTHSCRSLFHWLWIKTFGCVRDEWFLLRRELLVQNNSAGKLHFDQRLLITAERLRYIQFACWMLQDRWMTNVRREIHFFLLCLQQVRQEK